MSTPISPWGLRILDLLADGQWHVIGQVVDEAAMTVPPGVAYRRGENMRRSRGGPVERAQGGADTAIRTGARNKAYEAIMTRVYRGTIDRRVSRTGVVRIRLNRSALRRAS